MSSSSQKINTKCNKCSLTYPARSADHRSRRFSLWLCEALSRHHLHRSSHAGFLALEPEPTSQSSRSEALFSCLPVQTPCFSQPWLSGESSLGEWMELRAWCKTQLPVRTESIVAVSNTGLLSSECKWVCSTNFQLKTDRWNVSLKGRHLRHIWPDTFPWKK